MLLQSGSPKTTNTVETLHLVTHFRISIHDLLVYFLKLLLQSSSSNGAICYTLFLP